MEGIARCLADMRAFAAAIPAEVLEENKRRILAAIADKNAKPATRFARRTSSATSRQQSAKDFASPRIHPVLLWSAAGIAATLVMIFGIFFRDRTPATGIPEPATPAAPVAATHSPAKNVEPKAALSANQERPITLVGLKEEFAKLKASDAGGNREFLNRLRRFLAGAKGLDEQVDAANLLVATYEKMDRKDLAREAFGQYLGYIEHRDGMEEAARLTREKARRLFWGEKDYVEALAHYDIILTRYSSTTHFGNAMYMIGKYQYVIGNRTEAIRAYSQVAGELPSSNLWARLARAEVPADGKGVN
jgi:tetratricopeptide (TPR) repeat protein